MKTALIPAVALLTAACGSEQPRPEASQPDAPQLETPTERGLSAVRASRRERGIEFRAIGQEPGWLSIDEGVSMRLLYDYGERSATVSVGAPETEAGRRVYTGVNGTDSLRVVVEDTPCSGVMSGEPFPASVEVSINGRVLTGCGRAL